MKLLPADASMELRRKVMTLFSDFFHYTTAEDFTTVVSDAGTIATEDAEGGVVVLTPSDGTVADNDEAYLKSTVEAFKFASDQPIEFAARVKFSEANTDDANVIVGIANAVAADYLQDNGGGPPANYQGVNFHKVDGGTKWVFESSFGTTQTTTTLSDVTTPGDGTYRVLAFEVRPVTSVLAEVIPFIDGVQCRDANGVPVKHIVDFTTSPTEMQVGIGVKNGNTNLETLRVDWVMCRQLRAA